MFFNITSKKKKKIQKFLASYPNNFLKNENITHVIFSFFWISGEIDYSKVCVCITRFFFNKLN
jgi:hypothetical protein